MFCKFFHNLLISPAFSLCLWINICIYAQYPKVVSLKGKGSLIRRLKEKVEIGQKIAKSPDRAVFPARSRLLANVIILFNLLFYCTESPRTSP